MKDGVAKGQDGGVCYRELEDRSPKPLLKVGSSRDGG